MRYIAIILIILVMPAAVFSDMDIHSMVVNDRVLEFTDTRQLTFAEDGKVVEAAVSPDGKQVAFISEDEDSSRLCLVSTTGGKVTVVMDNPFWEQILKMENSPKEWWYIDHLQWSPNGDTLILDASKSTAAYDESGNFAGTADGKSSYLLVLAKNGKFKTSIPYDDMDLSHDLKFSPDTRFIATVCSIYPDNEPDDNSEECIIVFDLEKAQSRIIMTDKAAQFGTIKEWATDGQSIVWQPSMHSDKLKRVWLDGRPAEDAGSASTESLDSPDGQLRVVPDETKISIKNLQTGTEALIINDDGVMFIEWAPNSRMFLYSREQTIIDMVNNRTKEIDTLWLAHTGSSKPSSMLIALNHGWTSHISSDCTRVFYVSDKGRLCVSELVWNDLSAEQKMAAGLPLTEQDEKDIMMANAKEIGVAMYCYWNDYDGNLPPIDNFDEAIGDYLRNKNALCRPGTDQVIFMYTPPPGAVKESDIESSADTVLGEFDAGYSWKVVLYADAHVKVVPKGD